MATTKAAFCPQVWSSAILKTYKDNMWDAIKPKRSPGTQLLRDAALGHPEYPEDWHNAKFVGNRDTVELTSFTITTPGV